MIIIFFDFKIIQLELFLSFKSKDFDFSKKIKTNKSTRWSDHVQQIRQKTKMHATIFRIAFWIQFQIQF